MANNCLQTKLKSSVDNNNLLKIGEGIFSITPTSEYVRSTAGINFRFNEASTIRVVGDGYMGLNFSTIDTERLTSITVSANAVTTIYFSNGTYNVIVSNKYNLVYFETTGGSPSLVKADTPNVGKYYPALIRYSVSGGVNSIGQLSDLNGNEELRRVDITNTGINGSILDVANLPLTVLRVYNSRLSVAPIEDFVNSQNLIEVTDTLANPRSTNGFLAKCTFNNKDYSNQEDGENQFVGWQGTSKIYIQCPVAKKVYHKGCSSMVSSWEQAGYTVIDVTEQ